MRTRSPNQFSRHIWQQYVVVMSVAAAIAVLTGVFLMFRSAEEIDRQPIAQAEPQPPRKSAAPADNLSTVTAGDQQATQSPPSAHAEAPPKIGPFEPLESQNEPPPTEQDSPTSMAETKQPAAEQHPSTADRPPTGDTRPATANSTSAEASEEASRRKAAEEHTAAPDQPTQTPPKSAAAAESENTWLKLDDHGEPCEVTLANGTVVKLDTYGDEYEGYDYRPPMTLYDPKLRKLIDFKYVRGHGTGVSHLRFDSQHNRMYWIWTDYPHRVGKILRADLDGHGIVNLVTELESIGGFTIDPSRKKLYWTERKSLVDSVKSANLDGSNVQDIVPGAEGGGMAVEPESGDVLYYTLEGGTAKRSINRIKADGSGETEIIKDPYVVGSARQIIIEPVARKLYWRSGDSSIRRADYDGSGAEFVVDAEGVGHGGNFALDSGDKKVYWTTSSCMQLCRANLDGSQTEVLLVSPPEHENPNHREIAYVAFEPEHRQLYVSWYYFEGGPPAIGVLSRMEIPSLSKPVAKPAPPWIASVSPAAQAAGGEVVLKGKGLDSARKVALFDDGNGHEVPAQFEARSDCELAFTMPKLSEGCAHAAVIVLTEGGVTVTIPLATSLARPAIYVPLPGQIGINTDFVTGRYSSVWYVQGQTKRVFNAMSQATKTSNGGGIKSLIYAENGSIVSTKERGNNVLFLKDGAITGMSRWRTVIYHEPFAVINNSFRKSAKETETTLVPVPAIRPSFVNELLAYKQPQ